MTIGGYRRIRPAGRQRPPSRTGTFPSRFDQLVLRRQFRGGSGCRYTIEQGRAAFDPKVAGSETSGKVFEHGLGQGDLEVVYQERVVASRSRSLTRCIPSPYRRPSRPTPSRHRPLFHANPLQRADCVTSQQRKDRDAAPMFLNWSPKPLGGNHDGKFVFGQAHLSGSALGLLSRPLARVGLAPLGVAVLVAPGCRQRWARG